MTRNHLMSAATAMIRLNREGDALTDWARNLRGRAGVRRSLVGLARKLAVVLLAMWKTGEAYTAGRPGSATPGDLNRSGTS